MTFVPLFAQNEINHHQNVYVNLRSHAQLLHPFTTPYSQFSGPFFVNALSLSSNDAVSSSSSSNNNNRNYCPDFFFPQVPISMPTSTPILTPLSSSSSSSSSSSLLSSSSISAHSSGSVSVPAPPPPAPTPTPIPIPIPAAASIPISMPTIATANTNINAATTVTNKEMQCIGVDPSSSFINSATNSTQNPPVLIVLPSSIESQSQLTNNGTTRPVDVSQKYLYDTNQQQLFWSHGGFAPVSLAQNTSTNDDSNNINKSSTNGNIAHIIVVENNNDKCNGNASHNTINSNTDSTNLGNFDSLPIFTLPPEHTIDNHIALKDEGEKNNAIVTANTIDIQVPTAEDKKKDVQYATNGSVQQPSGQCQDSPIQEKKSFVPTGSSSVHSGRVSFKAKENNGAVNPPRKYGCKECDKVFNNRHNLSHHMRYHRNDRRFKCEDCNKAFFQKIHLIEHKRIHTGEKPHECPICRRRFRHSTNLKRHVKSIHLDEHFQCHLCAQSFKRKATLKRHMVKIHPGSNEKS